MKISQRVAGVEYAIRDITLSAKKLEKQGQKITYLNIGDPVAYGFQPPENVKDALIKAIKNNQNYYAPSEGLPELRQAIAEKEKRKGLLTTEDDIIVTNGVSEGLEMLMASIVESGDEVLIPGPYYPPYASYVRLFGGIPVEFGVDLNNSTPDLDDIKSKITSKTVAICFISPNNPTGAVFSEKSLKDLIDIAIKNDLYIICDEIYDQIVFDEKFVGIGKVSGDSPVILLNGFSKVHLMSGWRIGYIAFNNSKKLDILRENVPKLARVRIASNLPVQHAALESLRGPQDYIPRFVSELKKRRDYVIKRLNGMHNLSCSNPKGAF
ncbi:MAG: aminotransferase class I/II-fold pyridoxal phosphate-dependent enzyme [Thaumarchaeota archaeon]|nr:aminotransferase class I/II-fold pyridoxal phosphate-dependent enzyme [Nitrososphaerota archaeon]